MALAHAILAFLSEHPCSGYDLAKQFGGTVGNFWKATHQQIYRELAKLETEGWISAEVIQQANRPDKKLYSVTEVGRQQLIQWIGEPAEVAAIKEDLLVKVYAGHLVEPQVMIQELQRHRQLHLEKLSAYQEIEQQYFQNPQDLPAIHKFSYLTLLRGIHYEADYVAWCDEALELLR
ncbi:PadR family transcriptional regulator [Leptolyngbya sp. 'hensonii']|uniref:PadR family transcriptional regulator n=1 Tax=Leptolyngbya sp. 'hensonii' TaxID=1922337 RepID=UPI00094F755C|nr:PadR family transcriptional regulator [Leptolyngbya sp. 'hensonii']OLP18893.1 PadR family transcriptional regulator [Leptolyngbya sp. 'hensonii']